MEIRACLNTAAPDCTDVPTIQGNATIQQLDMCSALNSTNDVCITISGDHLGVVVLTENEARYLRSWLQSRGY